MFLSSLENFNYDRTEVSQMTEVSVTTTVYGISPLVFMAMKGK